MNQAFQTLNYQRMNIKGGIVSFNQHFAFHMRHHSQMIKNLLIIILCEFVSRAVKQNAAQIAGQYF